MTKIVVKVTTQSGRPIEQAEVVINFVQGKSIIHFGKDVKVAYDMHTNQEGVAKIPAIPQGNIKVFVSARGYQTYGETLEIRDEEKAIGITLNPPQPQYSAH